MRWVLESERPDLMALQESGMRDMSSECVHGRPLLPQGYSWAGNADVAIIYKSHLFELWPTSEVLKEEGKVIPVHLLVHRESGKPFFLLSYHGRRNGLSEEKKVDIACSFLGKVLAYQKRLNESVPVLLGGDFNVNLRLVFEHAAHFLEGVGSPESLTQTRRLWTVSGGAAPGSRRDVVDFLLHASSTRDIGWVEDVHSLSALVYGPSDQDVRSESSIPLFDHAPLVGRACLA